MGRSGIEDFIRIIGKCRVYHMVKTVEVIAGGLGKYGSPSLTEAGQ